ncbi:MAG: methyl-accepting chemotaxis protein [Myxococcota bacterium]|nr:methyl-accepting chemotaxis protein [Myxococcota bacterium]
MVDSQGLAAEVVAGGHKQWLRHIHLIIQKIVVYYVAPATAIFFAILAVLAACWQTYAVFIGSLLTSVCWVYGLVLTRKDRIISAVSIFVISTVCLVTLVYALIKGTAPTCMIAAIAAIVYASFHQRRLMIYCSAGVLISFVFSEMAMYADLYPVKELSAGERLFIEVAFAAILFPVIALVLDLNRKMNNGLVASTKKINAELSTIIATAADVGKALEDVVDRLEEVSNAFASQAGEQAASTREMSVSISHLRNTAKETASSAAETHAVSARFREKSETGSDQVRVMREGFQNVVEINDAAKAEFAALAEQAEDIEEVLRTNREIAAQIKVLAINAGIEASRAGDYGSGFRVVANELKGMIQGTDESLSHSKQLLEGIRNQARHSARTVEKSSELLKSQLDELLSTGALIEEISSAFVSTATRVERITNAAKEQQVRLDEVASGINHIEFAASELSESTFILVENVNRIAGSHQNLTDVLQSRASAGE